MMNPLLYEGRDCLSWNWSYNEQVANAVALGYDYILGSAVSRERFIDGVRTDTYVSIRIKVETVPLVMRVKTLQF